jgi:GxxExxY protein
MSNWFAIETQNEFPVFYRSVIVDPKVVVAFNEAHVAQMVGYLAISGLELALLINFQKGSLGVEASRGSTKTRIRSS